MTRTDTHERGTEREKRPSLGQFDLSGLYLPPDGILYVCRSAFDGFWRIYVDADMALQEATGYPVGELVEYEEMGDWEDGEVGELRALFVGEPESDESEEGLYPKYEVRKEGERVEDCFVLEPESDPAAREALIAYADATDNDALSEDLRGWVRSTEGSL